MNYLAIDTSGEHLSIVICKDDKIYKYYQDKCGVKHSVVLMEQVEKLAMESGFDFNVADFFCAVVGAGSFTGIRIGVSTVKAFCLAYNKPCLSVTSFDCLAYNMDIQNKVLAIIDAGHNGYYCCGYKDNKIVDTPCYILLDKLLELEKDYDIKVSKTPIEGINVKDVSLIDGLVNAIKSLYKNATLNWDSLTPLYCRKSQAEEGRP